MRRAAGRRRDERGAVLVITGIAMVVLLGFTSLALDLGYQRVARRDMQALADVVALDLVRWLDEGRSVADIEADPAWSAARDASVARNSDTQGEPPEVTPVLGEVDPDTREFTELTGDAIPNAVKVTAETDVDFFFRPGTGGAVRSAVATVGDVPIAAVEIGTKLASLDTNTPSVLNPLLTQLLGAGNPPLNLDLVSYQGLANANLSLGVIAGELGFGTVEALLAADAVSAADIVRLSATAVGANTPAALTLNQFAARIENVDVRLGDMITVADGNPDAGADVAINMFDLLLGTAQLANQTEFVSVPGLTLGIPGLLTSTLRLRVVEPPRWAIGPASFENGDWVTKATTAQIDTELDTAISVNTGPGACVPLLGCAPPLLAVDLTLPIRLGAAEGSAALTGIECAGTTPLSVSVLGTTDAANATASTNLSVKVSGLAVPLPPILHAAVPLAGGTRSFTFVDPFDPSAPQAMAATGLGLSRALVADLELLGLVDVGAVLALLNPTLSLIDSRILDPLFKGLGLSVAGADVRTLGAVCRGGQVALVG